MRFLSPWDAMPWFETPRTTIVATAGTTWTKLCGRDPRRVALIIGPTTAGVTISVATADLSPGSAGLVISTNTPLTLSWGADGALVQAEWWGVLAGMASAAVIELLLRDWPGREEALYAG